MQQKQAQSLINIVSKLRIFQGLSLNEAGTILQICASRTLQAAEIVCHVGEPSHDMFILLQGRLKVVAKNGTELGEILPGASCGEMGVFTGSPRSATVVSSQQSAGFTLGKQDVQTLLRNNPDIHVKIQQNIIALLSERLTKADLSIESYADRLKDAEDNYGAG